MPRLRQRAGSSAPGLRQAAALLLVLPLLLVLLCPSPARAQTVTALQDTTCAGFRQTDTLNCTSGEFTVGATFSGAANTPAFCTAGQVFIFNASLSLSGSNTDRYDIGFYVGQQGNAPTAATAGNICSVAVFPTTPSPWEDDDLIGANNTCGDFNGGGAATPQVSGLKVVCAAAAGETDLTIPYVLTYRQNTGSVCTSAANVNANSKSKCNAGAAKLQVSTAPVQVGGYVDLTKQTLPDGSTQAFSYTATGPAGSSVGVEINGVSRNNFGDADLSNNNTYTFTLTDGQTARVFMSVLPSTNRVLTITEQPSGQVLDWRETVDIVCNATAGSPPLTRNNTTRQITATLNTTNKAAACTITNTKRAKIALVEKVNGRLFTSDQFSLAVSGAGSTGLRNAAGTAIAASAVTVTTSGTATGTFTNTTNPSFRSTPGEALVLGTAMAAGSTSLLSSYSTSLTCTNAFTGSGATTGLPSGQATSSYTLTPAPGDDITCTYTHTPGALLTLAKVVVNDDGLSNVPTDWTLTATGPSTISGVHGSAAVTSAPVTPGTYTLSESGPAAYLRTGLACSGAADTNPADGMVLLSGEKATCTFTNNDQQVAQTLSKSAALLSIDADGSGTITEGDTLAYTVTMTNNGITTLTNVTVADPKLVPASQACPSVATGATCVLNGSHVVTASEAAAGQVVNTANVTSSQIPAPKSSNTVTTTVQARAAPALKVVKSHIGNFSAASNGSYTLQVSNTGYGAISGTTTVRDTLDPDLAFVSATGTGWSCSVAGAPQLVTCTSTSGVASFADMAPITLTVKVSGGIGSSVANSASVANTTLNGGNPVAGNTDTATVLHPDLSTSTKTVVNLGGGATADVDDGDVLEYTITLVETAGADASGVQVTDAIQAGLSNLTVTSVPAGATDASSGSMVDVSNIAVPANGIAQVKFRVTVGGGVFSPGDTIDNTAIIDNPGGPDATPVAPTRVYAQSQVVSSGDKILYLHAGGLLDRIPQGGIDTSGTVVAGTGSADWVLSPALAADLVLSAGMVEVNLAMATNGQAVVRVELWDGATQVGSSSPAQNLDIPSAQAVLFQIALGADYTVPATHQLTLRVVNTGGGNKTATVYAYNVGPSTVSFATSTVVHVDSVTAYSVPFASGNTTKPYFLHGDTAYIRAVASDPFGGSDVSASDSTITITNAAGAVVAGPTPMSMVATSGATRTFEYTVPIGNLAAIGNWTASVVAYEGTEHTINHAANGIFEVRGKVVLDQEWGAASNTGDTLALQVTGGSDAVAGSSVAPSAAIPATAAATSGATITLVQSFSSGDAGSYAIGLSCVRDADAVALPVTGSGLSRQIQMPVDSSVTCTWTDGLSTPLTIVKLAVVKSDPVNGVAGPKAIPGAVVEYQVIVTNPGTSPIDGNSLSIADPLPGDVELAVSDIGGPGSGPVVFSGSGSGLTYTFSALGSDTDDIDFSDSSGWGYHPSPGPDGFDPQVTGINVSPKGSFNGNGAQFTLRFQVRVK